MTPTVPAEAPEDAIARCCARRYGVGLAVGVDPLETTLLALGAERGDGVVAPALAIPRLGPRLEAAGFLPILLDVERDRLDVDPDRLARFLTEDCVSDGRHLFSVPHGCRVRGLIVTHSGGRVARLKRIRPLVAAHDAFMLELVGEVIGLAARDADEVRPVGAWGRAALFEELEKVERSIAHGAVVATDDPELVARLRALALIGGTGLDLPREEPAAAAERLAHLVARWPGSWSRAGDSGRRWLVEVPDAARAVRELTSQGIAAQRFTGDSGKHPVARELEARLVSLPVGGTELDPSRVVEALEALAFDRSQELG